MNHLEMLVEYQEALQDAVEVARKYDFDSHDVLVTVLRAIEAEVRLESQDTGPLRPGEEFIR